MNNHNTPAPGEQILIDALEEYVRFLDVAYNRTYRMAHVHGYRETKEDIAKGLSLRERISDAKSAIAASIAGEVKEQVVCRWVKASERLPDISERVVIRNMVKDNFVANGKFYIEVDGSRFISTPSTSGERWRIEDVEWLEEVTTPLPVDTKPDNKVAKGDYVHIEMDGCKYFWCKCESCGWENSSEYCEGGAPIGDTGDYSDATCPVCGSTALDGDSKYEPDDNYKNHIVEIPFNDFIAPYKEIAEKANRLEADKFWSEPTLHVETAKIPDPKGEAEKAAEEYANGFYRIKPYDHYESDYDYRTQCAKNRQLQEHFLAGVKWKGDKEAVDDQILQRCFCLGYLQMERWKTESFTELVASGDLTEKWRRAKEFLAELVLLP